MELKDLYKGHNTELEELLNWLLEAPDEMIKSLPVENLFNYDEFGGINKMVDDQIQEFVEQRKTHLEVRKEMEEATYEIKTLLTDLKEQKGLSQAKAGFITSLFSPLVDMLNLVVERYPQYDAAIPIEFCHENARLPLYAHDDDVGADVYAVENMVIAPYETTTIPTGIKMAIPKGWGIAIRPRSGLSLRTKMRFANSTGTIDSGYLDEVKVIVDNIGEAPIEIKAGDRIAQFILERKYKANFVETNDIHTLADNDRKGGIGSTGK